MAGPAIRAVEISRCLANDFPVILAAPDAPGTEARTGEILAYRNNPRELRAAAAVSRLIVIQGAALELLPWLASLSAPLVVDLYDPFHLESMHVFSSAPAAYQDARHRFDLGMIRHQLALGDFFVCASERQRHFWLGMLSAIGRVEPRGYARDPTFRALIDVVPFGVAGKPPEHSRRVLKGVYPGIKADDQVVLWGGGLWDWLDPLTLIRALARLQPTHPRLKVFFMGTRRPGDDAASRRSVDAAVQLARDLGVSASVIFNDWVPYEDRHNFLLEADVGVSLGLRHIEGEYAFRTRILDYIWTGLPTVCTRGDATADLVEHYGLGLTVDARSEDQLVDALRRVLDDPTARSGRASEFERVAAQLSWSRATEPLRRFARDPAIAADNPRRVGKGRLEREIHAGRERVQHALWLVEAARASYGSGGPRRLARDLARYFSAHIPGKRVT
jgi:glycosyltransferase involved in cell wall biosynthesis